MTCYVPPGSKKTPGPVIKVNSLICCHNLIFFTDGKLVAFACQDCNIYVYRMDNDGMIVKYKKCCLSVSIKP